MRIIDQTIELSGYLVIRGGGVTRAAIGYRDLLTYYVRLVLVEGSWYAMSSPRPDGVTGVYVHPPK